MLLAAPRLPAAQKGFQPRAFNVIKTIGMIFASPAVFGPIGGTWDISTLMTSPTNKGFNWQFYKQALQDAGYPAAAFIDNGTTFQVGGAPNGDAVCFLASLFDWCALGDWPTWNVLKRIKWHAARRDRTIRLGNYFVNYETLNQGPSNSAPDEYLRQIVKNNYLMTGTGLNSYGCIRVDPFETSGGSKTCPPADAAPGTGHLWYANCYDLSGAEAAALSIGLRDMFQQHYAPHNIFPDFYIVDNALDRPNMFVPPVTNWTFGTPNDAEYQAYYKLFMTACQANVPFERWFNRGDVGQAQYTTADCANRYGEFFFHLNGNSLENNSELLSVIQTNLQTAKTNGIRMVMDHGKRGGASEVDQWTVAGGPGGTKGTWRELRTFINTNGLRETAVAMALRTSGSFYGHWQPEFGVMY